MVTLLRMVVSKKLKIAGWTALSILLIGIGVGVWIPKFTLFTLPDGEVRVLETSTIVQKIQGLSQLVTVTYIVEKVVVIEDEKWYGESRVLLVAHGIVKAGIDLGRLQVEDVEVEGNTLRVFMPPATITDTYLDEDKTHVIERTTGILREFDKDLEQNARRVAIGDIRRAARMNGIIKEAETRARDQLQMLFLQLGFEKVEIIPHSGLSVGVD
jgi:hypothetical protein